MIVCLCRNKSERDVHNAIHEGASTLLDLQRCGIGTDCGSCHNMLRTMLAEAERACPVCAETAAAGKSA